VLWSAQSAGNALRRKQRLPNSMHEAPGQQFQSIGLAYILRI